MVNSIPSAFLATRPIRTTPVPIPSPQSKWVSIIHRIILDEPIKIDSTLFSKRVSIYPPATGRRVETVTIVRKPCLFVIRLGGESIRLVERPTLHHQVAKLIISIACARRLRTVNQRRNIPLAVKQVRVLLSALAQFQQSANPTRCFRVPDIGTVNIVGTVPFLQQ